MLKWIKRCQIQKEEGHVTYLDLYVDTETGVQYFGMANNLTPRYDSNGNLFISKQ